MIKTHPSAQALVGTVIMSTSYRALIHESADSPLTLTSMPVPSQPIPNGTALVQPLYASIASYSRSRAGNNLPVPYPFVPGGSCVARIEALGADATLHKPGDIVWVSPIITSRDDPDISFLLGYFGGTTPESQKLMADAWPRGSFAEKLAVPLESCFALPKSLFEPKSNRPKAYQIRDMAFLSFILVGFAGLVDVGVGPGTTVIVAPATGKYSGGAVLAALALGAKVVAASRNADKMEILRMFPGARERLSTVRLTGDVDEDTKGLLAATDGKGAHVYMDVCPPLSSMPSHFASALKALRRNGQVILEGGLRGNVSFNYVEAMLKNLTIRGKYMYERHHVQRAIDMIENGNLVLGEDAGLTIKAVYGLDDVDKAVTSGEGNEWWGGDVLLAPNGETC